MSDTRALIARSSCCHRADAVPEVVSNAVCAAAQAAHVPLLLPLPMRPVPLGGWLCESGAMKASPLPPLLPGPPIAAAAAAFWARCCRLRRRELTTSRANTPAAAAATTVSVAISAFCAGGGRPPPSRGVVAPARLAAAGQT
jgi:hypothetical protein